MRKSVFCRGAVCASGGARLRVQLADPDARGLCLVRSGMVSGSPLFGRSSTPSSISPMKSGDEAVSLRVRSSGDASSWS
eukprot:scaffold6068_cov119-Isochrysis_galbana.AAC.6